MLGLRVDMSTHEVAPRTAITDPDVLRFLKAPLPARADEHLRRMARRLDESPLTVYLSTPITTGPRHLAYRLEAALDPSIRIEERDREVARELTAENLRALEPIKAHVRSVLPAGAQVIDPTELDEPAWGQRDYHRFWIEVIRRFAEVVVFADGWEYSTGCSLEFATAVALGLPMFDSRIQRLDRSGARKLLEMAAIELSDARLPVDSVELALRVVERSDVLTVGSAFGTTMPLKDDRLASIARSQNVALFASFEPYSCRLRHFVGRSDLSVRFEEATPDDAVAALLAQANEGSVNIRTFRPGESKGSPFIYGLTSLAEVVGELRRLASSGYYTIVNETIDVADGGVSGVSVGGIVEFAPGVTPRGVETDDAAQLSLKMANSILRTVYGDEIEVPHEDGKRIEFSIHPKRVGSMQAHVCVWEIEDVDPFELRAIPSWPNAFSRVVGDKTFGLLVAGACGVQVPRTFVVARRVAPFTFGMATGSGEWWMRTAPARQDPGRFTTTYGWTDPFALLASEDPKQEVAAVLAQEGVSAQFSGASLPMADGRDVIEAVAGMGDAFMLGAALPVELPPKIRDQVASVLATIRRVLGPVRIEWAFDGDAVWILQMHRAGVTLEGVGGFISPGDAAEWLPFDPADGLEALRALIKTALSTQAGIMVTRRIGLTSHVGDLLRKAGVPGRFSATIE